MFFFFKQKTAYEMRISDWSSDVCSSDLIDLIALAHAVLAHRRHANSSDFLTPEEHLASRGCQFTGQHGKECGFARPVGANHTVQLAFPIGRASCRERVCQFV